MKASKPVLTKAELIDSIMMQLDVERPRASDLVEMYLEMIKQGLERDGRVMLSGFGCYEVREKKPRRGRNPQTGESLILRARKIVKFRPSQLLKKAVNNPKYRSGDASWEEDEAGVDDEY